MPSSKNNFLLRRSESRQAIVVSFVKGRTSQPRSFPRKRESMRLNHLRMRCKGLDSRFRGNDQCFKRNPLPNDTTIGLAHPQPEDGGFSLLEMMVSVLIILLLMSAIFPFIMQSQKRFQGNEVTSESNQSARAALEVMTQEIGQAGYNPQFSTAKTSSTSLSATGCTQFLPVSDVNGINPGDWVSVDTGQNQELVQVFSTSSAVDTNGSLGPASPVPINEPPSGSSNCVYSAPPAGTWIQSKFSKDHTTAAGTVMPYSISSYKMPYGGGLLVAFDTSGNLITTPDCPASAAPCSLSNRKRLEFYGDINQDGNINYVVYSISPMVPTTTATINGTVYTLYSLYRSITQVPFQSLPTPTTYTPPANAIASPMVEKVLFNTTTAAACTDGVAGCGPTGQPIFSYPNTVTVGVVPNQITVVGTIVITICVAVNPESLETGVVQWYTMATQIRPLNLSAAVNINNSNGSLYLAGSPRSIPLSFPSGYYP